MKDVCPVTMLGCPTPLPCAVIQCSRSKGAKPIDERRLTKPQLYALAMDDRRRERSNDESNVS